MLVQHFFVVGLEKTITCLHLAALNAINVVTAALEESSHVIAFPIADAPSDIVERIADMFIVTSSHKYVISSTP